MTTNELNVDVNINKQYRQKR